MVHLLNWAAQCENLSSGICGQRRPRSACASAQSGQSLRRPYILDTTECINGEKMPLCIPVSMERKCPYVSLYQWRENALMYPCIGGEKMPLCIPVSMERKCPYVSLYQWRENALMYPSINGEKMPLWGVVHVQDNVNPHILRMLKGTFSSDEAQCGHQLPNITWTII